MAESTSGFGEQLVVPFCGSLALFFSSILITDYFRVVKKPEIVVGSSSRPRNDKGKKESKFSKVLDSCPCLHETFWPSPYCWNAHLQFVPFVLRGIFDRFIDPPFQWATEYITTSDGEILCLEWVVACTKKNDLLSAWKQQGCANILSGNGEDCVEKGVKLAFSLPESVDSCTPIVVLQHGAMCDSRDLPGQSYILPALERGWIVCALNRRGHAGPLTRPKWNFFGCPDDLHTITQHILQRRPQAKLFTVGISSGSGLVARHFGQSSERGDTYSNDFTAGVGVCPGYDISRCMLKFGSPYMDLLLWRGKDFFLRQNARLLDTLPGFSACNSAQNLQEWLEQSYAMAGCNSCAHYYERYNPMKAVMHIKKPCLFINAENDPLCTVDNLWENLHILSPGHKNALVAAQIDQETSENDSNGVEIPAAVVLTKTGSHCVFYEGFWMDNWAEKASFQFFDAVLAHEM